MTERDPVRWLDPESGIGAELRAALEAGRTDLPDTEQLASLAAKLGPLLGPGGGGGAGGGGGGGTGLPPATGSGGAAASIGSAAAGGFGGGLAAKAAAALVLSAAVAGSGAWLWKANSERTGGGDEPVVAMPAPEPATPGPLTPEQPPALPPGVDPDEAEPSTTPSPPAKRTGSSAPAPVPPAPTPADAGAPPSDPNAELALVREAQDALRSGQAARALALTREHASRFAGGVLAQEREVVAIDALVRLGQRDEAARRAEAFTRRWPGSAHARRIEVILGRGAAPDNR